MENVIRVGMENLGVKRKTTGAVWMC